MNFGVLAQIGGVLAMAGVALGVLAIAGSSRPPRPRTWLRRLVARRSDRERRVRRIVLVGACVGGCLGWLVTGMPVVGAVIAVAVPGAPWLVTVGRSERRAIARVEAVGEWTRRLKDICGTGVGLQQAIVASTATAPDGIEDEVGMLAARLQAGWQPRNALLQFADSIGDPVCDQVVAALILNLADRGEHLGDVLSSIASAASAEVASRREVDAKRTQPRFAVRFLTGMTVLTFGYGITRDEYMRPYATPTGQVVLAVLAATFVALLLWVRRMSLPPRAARFLTVVQSTVDGP
jgi:Flp pilus assembly protein TadB